MYRDRAILAYLEENNHTAAFEALKLSTRLVSDEKSAGLLTKRWRAVMALQKQVNVLVVLECNYCLHVIAIFVLDIHTGRGDQAAEGRGKKRRHIENKYIC